MFFHRKELRTLGNLTTNRTERFFHMLKAAMRGRGRKRGRRLHLGDSIWILMAVVAYKISIKKFMEFVKILKVSAWTVLEEWPRERSPIPKKLHK